MKTDEKQSKRNMTNEGRKAFYTSFVSKLDPKKIYEPIEINDIIEETINEQGGSHVHRSHYINNLCKIIGGKNYDIVEDKSARTRGRSKRYLFSLKTTHEELYRVIDEFFKSKKGSVSTEEPSLKPTPKARTEETPEIPMKKGISPKDLKSITKLWTIISESIKRKITMLDFETIGKMLGMTYQPSRQMFERWIASAKEVGIYIEYIYKLDGRTTWVILQNPTNSLLNINKGMAERGKIFDPTPILKMRPVIEDPKKLEDTPTQEEEKELYSAEVFKSLSEVQKRNLWHIAGVLMEYGNRPLDIVVIGKRLHEEFRIVLSGAQIRSLIKITPAFLIFSSGAEVKIQLRQRDDDGGREAFEFLKKTISPFTSKSNTLARLSMTLEEVKQYLPESTVESQITPSDNIFRIVFNSTKKDYLMLGLLVIGCRGTDKFFDKGIESFAKSKIKSIGDLLTTHDSEYRIENL